MTKIYGELESEKIASENNIARRIVKEINDFGINDRQRWMIIKLIALEIECVDHMKALVGVIDELKGEEIFVSRIFSSGDSTDSGQEV